MPKRSKIWFDYLDQTRREIILATVVLIFLNCVGMLGYMLIEEWSWQDGLYMTFITITTIGFTEVHALSEAGRFFTILLAVGGIGTVALVAARSAQFLLIGDRLRERQLLRKINGMRNHYIVCGYGRIGKRVVEDLANADRSLVIIDKDDEVVQALQSEGVMVVHGDAEDEETLRRAGIDQAGGLILTLPDDSVAVFVTLVARELNPDFFILARTSDLKNKRKLIRAGANKVVAPIDVGADRMAQVILRPNVDRFVEQALKSRLGDLEIEEVKIESGAPIVGQSLAESQIRQKFDTIVIAVIDATTKEMKYNASPHDPLAPGDILIVLGKNGMIQRLRMEGCSVKN